MWRSGLRSHPWHIPWHIRLAHLAHLAHRSLTAEDAAAERAATLWRGVNALWGLAENRRVLLEVVRKCRLRLLGVLLHLLRCRLVLLSGVVR